MKNYRIYSYITLGFALFFFVISLFSTPYFVRHTIKSSLENDIAAGKQEASQMALLSGELLNKNVDKQFVIESIQKAIANTNNENVFLSVIDWSGKVVSYPDVTNIGISTSDSSNEVATMESLITPDELYEIITSKLLEGNQNIGSNIIYIKSIPNSDLIVATHINEKKIQEKIDRTRNQFNIAFLILGLLTLLFTLSIIRYLSSFYEKLLDQKTIKIEDSVLSLSKLNSSLDAYQKNLLELKKSQVQLPEEQTQETPVQNIEKSKQRLLTYVRNELVSIPTEDIAYIYVDNTITYVIRKDGKRSTTNDSLDQIFSSLDEQLFFRANRQIIVAIHAIETITKFGNSALKIQTDPESEVEIVIGKNKAASFKQWLDL
ncbi:LytTR family transcriptional regulator [Dokdonia sinensis]|uniref:LytTR family transcriptional regulator n=1 Tax=Dokdonia sinensis TaxID=2479847 RepID=A0A3M0GDF3_9FLAO|nr:LytTR family DNA-binding domain-containing protein [Dokdonia sinensis]RMB62750.1 LytTR family transcriptional regulator [Dokdonia sinensis]